MPHYSYQNKLDLVLQHPAMLKVAILLADIFSLAEIKSKNSSFLQLFENPNPFQTRTQFLWDYMFWIVIGNAYCITDTKQADKENQYKYWLNMAKIEFPEELKKKLSKHVLSKNSYNDILESEVIYNYGQNNVQKIKIKDLIIINDTSSGLGDNWLLGKSRLDALYKIITTSDVAIDAKRDNLDFTRKFLVNGKVDIENINELPMSEIEKSDIETKLSGKRKIHAVKTPVQINRFTDSIKKLALDESYMNDLHLIGNMFNIPKDVIEAVGTGTWDNQKTARATLVEFALQAKGDDLMDSFAKHYGFDIEKDEIAITWENLSFNQVLESERADTVKKKADALKVLVDNGAKANEVAELLNLDLKFSETNN